MGHAKTGIIYHKLQELCNVFRYRESEFGGEHFANFLTEYFLFIYLFEILKILFNFWQRVSIKLSVFINCLGIVNNFSGLMIFSSYHKGLNSPWRIASFNDTFLEQFLDFFCHKIIFLCMTL